ncbi:MAG: potassium channel family protein [Spirochaetota bacterium]
MKIFRKPKPGRKQKTDELLIWLSELWTAVNKNNNLLLFLIVIGLILASSVSVYSFELGINRAFRSLWDSLWWTIVTMTTVGYGDKVPVTTGGKVMGVVLMVLGVATVGMVTGRIASFLVDKQIKARGGLIVLDKKKGHYIICGWKDELESILNDILLMNPSMGSSDMVLVNDADPEQVDHIRSLPGFRSIKYIKGDYIDDKVLARANVKNAAAALVLADASKKFSLQEVDSRTVMSIITIDSMNKNIYTCAELIDEKFMKYLQLANCDEIILTREYTRVLLANAATASGISHITSVLLKHRTGGLVTREFPQKFVGKPFSELQKYFKDASGDLVIGLLENTGKIYFRKKEALAEAQKTPDISRLVENLQSVKQIKPNEPVINPGDSYPIKSNSRAILITRKSVL